ncbi:cytochrome P450, putative [Ricinus communis]|uniref:Cytochrome P450, putative n=1 Tax=Ricinus communis TaxID=3988 RepID=B9T2D0_RICCO|nr:cytochrome P450, putative [Ricinus communis]
MADFQEYMILLLVWLVSMIVVRAVLRKFQAKAHLPPSPPALPIIGHLHLLGSIPHQGLHKLSIRYGPLIHISLGSIPCVVASSPETAKAFLKTHETSFLDRPKMIAVDYLTYGSADFSFTPYGPYWKFMKKLCMTELLGGRVLDQLLPVRHEEIRRFLKIMLKKANAGESIDVGGQLIRVTNNVISRMIMNQTCSEDEDEANNVRKLVQETAELTGKFNLSDFIWLCKNLDLQGFGRRMKEVRDKFDTMTERIITKHEEERKIKKDTGPLIVRESTETCAINGYEIPARTRLFVNVWALGRDPNHWDNPLEFSPERFMNAESNTKSQLDVKGQHFHLLPFGSGRRGCPGTSLALQMVQSSLVAMIQCFEWKVNGGNGTVDMEEGPGLTLSRANPLICVPVARLKPFPSF